MLLTNDQILERIAAGEFNANQYVKPRDATFLARLEPLLTSATEDVREEALRALVATQLPEAAYRLLRFCREEQNFQLRGEAVHGFQELHPAAILPELVALAREEIGDVLGGSLIRSIGLIGGDAARAALLGLKVSEPDRHFEHSVEFSWLLARIRCGDAPAVDVLARRLRALDAGSLMRCLGDLPYARNLPLAKALTGFFDDRRELYLGPRIQVVATPEGNADEAEAQARFTMEIRDLALAAILAMFPETPWGFDPSPRRRYAPGDFEAVKRSLGMGGAALSGPPA